MQVRVIDRQTFGGGGGVKGLIGGNESDGAEASRAIHVSDRERSG